MVASCEELSTRVWKYRLAHYKGSVQSGGQVGCQDQPEWVDVADEKRKKEMMKKCTRFLINGRLFDLKQNSTKLLTLGLSAIALL